MSSVPHESTEEVSAVDVGGPHPAPEADTVEQHRPAGREDPADYEFDLPLEADPADAADQHRVVGDPDEDEYR